MTDDAPRPLTEEERVLVQTARAVGGVCGWCGKSLAADETVWIERVDVDARGAVRWWVPVGVECASAAFRAETGTKEPEPCIGCSRGVYWRSIHPRRRITVCSKRCSVRYRVTRRKEGTAS